MSQLSLSPSAAKRVAFIAAKQGREPVLRLAVDGGGCAGFSYRFALGEAEEGDTSTSTDGVTLVVDPVSITLLEGCEVDYVEDLGGASFKVTNPNAASGCGCGSSFSVKAAAPRRAMAAAMKLVTFNINGIRARLPRLLEYLEREKPDIACLQELKCADDALPIGDIEGAGYSAVWHGQKGFNGVAILSKGDAPKLRQLGLPGDPDDSHSRYIEAEVDGLIVASIYLPNGNPVGTEKFDYKLRWMERLEARAAAILAEEKPAILAGDYNVIPEDRDTFSRSAMASDALFQPESQAAFRRIVHQGWTDALRLLNPDEDRLYTFWDYTAGAWPRDAGFRIDHLLCSPQAADRLRSAEVHKWARAEEKASDHAPVSITID